MDIVDCACGCGETFERKEGGRATRKYIDKVHRGRASARVHYAKHKTPPGAPKEWVQKYQRDYQLTRFGLTHEQYEAMLAEQCGGCAICGKPPGKRRLAVDHDHRCCPRLHACDKCRRGLLCTRCNTLLGHIDDDPQFLAKVFAYLDRK